MHSVAPENRAFSAQFASILREDGFDEAGMFGLDGAQRMYCQVTNTTLGTKTFAIYAFVGFRGGGQYLRIGKSEKRAVTKRIMEYPRYINEACDPSLGANGRFAGGTSPWERDEWFRHLEEFGTGVIFIKTPQLEGNADDWRTDLRNKEKFLIDKHQPILCNDCRSGKQLRFRWEELNGKATRHLKRQV